MNHIQQGVGIVALGLIGMIVGFSAAAAEIVAFEAGASGIISRPLVPFEHGVLTVATPDGTVFREEFGAGQSVVFSPFGYAGYHPPDGAYVWEIWLGQPSATTRASASTRPV